MCVGFIKQAMSNFSDFTNSTNATDDAFVVPLFIVSWQKVLLASVLTAIVTTTILGNLLVILAIKTDKRMQTPFNYYVINLAITDFLVGLSAMTFYSVDRVLGYWPFGEFMCGVWIFFDYGMTFASVFTLVAISLDRLWSVSWPINYQQNHSMSKVYINLAVVWTLMLVIWLPPCIIDRVRYSEPYICIWEPSNNKEFVVVVAVIGHHLPDIILVFCYVKLFSAMRKRAKVTIGVTKSQKRSAPSVSATVSQEQSFHTTSSHLAVPSTSSALSPRSSRQRVNPSGQHEQRKERRVFLTLTYILAGYAICWVPFHFVFDISAIKPEAVPPTVYSIFFYFTYANSTINPFLYHASNKDFKRAFRRFLHIDKETLDTNGFTVTHKNTNTGVSHK